MRAILPGLFAVVLVASPLSAAIVDYDFTASAQVGDWGYSTESTTDSVGSQQHMSSFKGNFTGHDGVMRWRPHHTGTSGDQAAIGWVDLGGVTDLTGLELATTGIHANRSACSVQMLVIYDDGGATYAVSDQSIRTSTGTSTPVAGSWMLDDLTFSALDAGNLLGGTGSAVDTATVLANATAVGYYSAFTGQSWMADRATQIDSYTIVPEPVTMGLLALGGAASVLRRRRK